MSLLKNHWQLFLTTTLVFLLWNTPVMVPLKILVVFLHELAHALATWATGGEVVSLTISAEQGGKVVSRGGSPVWILMAGYLGSLILGVLLFVIAVRTLLDRWVMGTFGVTMLLVSALTIRDGFALAFCIISGVSMLLVALFTRRAVNDLILRVMGLTSMIYVPYDIFSDTLARSHLRSDAYMLAEKIGGSTMLWGGLWLAISLVVIGCCLRFGVGKNSNLQFTKPPLNGK